MEGIIDFVAGCFGGIAGVVVGKPFDTVKVRLQTDNPDQPRYKGGVHCAKDILRTEGAWGYYKGVMSPIYGQAAINAIVFGVHSNTLKLITDNPQSLPANFIAGITAGASQSIVCSPVELVRIRMEMQGIGENMASLKQHMHYKGPLDCIVKIHQEEGLRHGVFRGFFATVAREGPSFGVYFLSYEIICQRIKAFLNLRKDAQLPVGPILFAGGVAGMCTWASTYPVDVVKTLVQQDLNGEYEGYMDCLRKTLRRQGAAGLYRGLGVCVVRAFPANAATFGAYEYSKRLIQKTAADAHVGDGYETLSSDGHHIWPVVHAASDSLEDQPGQDDQDDVKP